MDCGSDRDSRFEREISSSSNHNNFLDYNPFKDSSTALRGSTGCSGVDSVKSRLSVLQLLEKSHCRSYMAPFGGGSLTGWHIDNVVRCLLRRWKQDTCFRTRATALSYLDNVFSSIHISHPNHMLVAAQAVFLLAAKQHEVTGSVGNTMERVKWNCFESSYALYGPQSLIRMELTVARALDWKLIPVTCVDFMEELLLLLPVQREEARDEILGWAQRIAEAILMFGDLRSEYLPSEVAIAALGASILLFEKRCRMCDSVLAAAKCSFSSPNGVSPSVSERLSPGHATAAASNKCSPSARRRSLSETPVRELENVHTLRRGRERVRGKVPTSSSSSPSTVSLSSNTPPSFSLSESDSPAHPSPSASVSSIASRRRVGADIAATAAAGGGGGGTHHRINEPARPPAISPGTCPSPLPPLFAALCGSLPQAGLPPLNARVLGLLRRVSSFSFLQAAEASLPADPNTYGPAHMKSGLQPGTYLPPPPQRSPTHISGDVVGGGTRDDERDAVPLSLLRWTDLWQPENAEMWLGRYDSPLSDPTVFGGGHEKRSEPAMLSWSDPSSQEQQNSGNRVCEVACGGGVGACGAAHCRRCRRLERHRLGEVGLQQGVRWQQQRSDRSGGEGSLHRMSSYDQLLASGALQQMLDEGAAGRLRAASSLSVVGSCDGDTVGYERASRMLRAPSSASLYRRRRSSTVDSEGGRGVNVSNNFDDDSSSRFAAVGAGRRVRWSSEGDGLALDRHDTTADSSSSCFGGGASTSRARGGGISSFARGWTWLLCSLGISGQ